MRSTEVLGPVRSGGRVTGVRYRGADGTVAEMRADLTVGCDGRSSTLRAASGLATRSFGAPMDVWWFRLPRHDGDPHGLNGIFRSGHGCALIDRGDYFQIAYLIRKGTDASMRAEGIESLRRQVCELVPWLADRIDALRSFDDVKLLDVQLEPAAPLVHRRAAAHRGRGARHVPDRRGRASTWPSPTRWRRPGSWPTRCAAGRSPPGIWRRVQARRWLPAAIIQRVQRTVQDRAIAVAIGADDGPRTAPRAVRLANRFPALRAVAAYGVAIGPLPEHAPDLRPPLSLTCQTWPCLATSRRRAGRQSMMSAWSCSTPSPPTTPTRRPSPRRPTR